MVIQYTPQLFIFDIVTAVIIIIATIVVYLKTRELWQLSLQKGVKYLNNAMLMYLLSFTSWFLSIIMDFFTDSIYGNFQITYFGILLVFLNIFGAFMGGFYLAYSLIWRLFEKDRIKRFHPVRIVLITIASFVIVSADIYFMIFYGVKTPFLFFGIIIAWLIYAIIANFTRCRVFDLKKRDLNPFLSLVGLGLGVYIARLIENLLVSYLFTIHYYAGMIVVVFVLTFMYHIIKLTK